MFEGTRKPLRVWFQAMWYLTNQKFGVSALGLQRVLGLGSYQTAWTWLHKLRRAMVRPGREMLGGCVEVDETYIGGEEEGTAERAQLAGERWFIKFRLGGIHFAQVDVLCSLWLWAPRKSHPVGGVDYPQTLQEFDEWFWTERKLHPLPLETQMAAGLQMSKMRVSRKHG